MCCLSPKLKVLIDGRKHACNASFDDKLLASMPNEADQPNNQIVSIYIYEEAFSAPLGPSTFS
jgi:hypothetical protein